MTTRDCELTVNHIESQFKDFDWKRRKEISKPLVRVVRQRWNPSHERLADLEEMSVANTTMPRFACRILVHF